MPRIRLENKTKNTTRIFWSVKQNKKQNISTPDEGIEETPTDITNRYCAKQNKKQNTITDDSRSEEGSALQNETNVFKQNTKQNTSVPTLNKLRCKDK